MTHSRRTLFLILTLTLAVGTLIDERVRPSHAASQVAVQPTFDAQPASDAQPPHGAQPPPGLLPDLSGLAWVEGETFLAVHDAKVPDESGLPRVSLVELPHDGEPLRWTPLAVDWTDGAPSHDLESIARLPGTDTYLLVESGNHGSPYQRVFVADLAGETLSVREVAAWPVPVYDVEGTAVARVGGDLYFLFAERADSEPGTEIAWAKLTLDPLGLGEVRRVPFRSLGPRGPGVRHVSALEVDERGRVYAASAYDPDHDGGPFRSAVWCLGALRRDGGGDATLVLTEAPEHLATLGAVKVESLALYPSTGGAALVVGTDDEDYGGVVRPLPLGAPPPSDRATAGGPAQGSTESALSACRGGDIIEDAP